MLPAPRIAQGGQDLQRDAGGRQHGQDRQQVMGEGQGGLGLGDRQHDGLGGAGRVGIPVLGGQLVADGEVAQQLQVAGTAQPQADDHRGGLGQRQRQMSQLVSELSGAVGVGQAGAPPQEGLGLPGGEHLHLKRRVGAGEGSVAGGDDHPGRAGGRAPAANGRHVGGVVEDQQRRLRGSGQPRLGAAGGRGGVLVGAAFAQSLGQGGQAGQDLVGGLGGDPGHHRPAGGLAGPGVGGGQHGLAHPGRAGQRADHHRSAASTSLPVLHGLAQQVGQPLQELRTRLEAGRALRDIALDDLAWFRPGRVVVVDNLVTGRLIHAALP